MESLPSLPSIELLPLEASKRSEPEPPRIVTLAPLAPVDSTTPPTEGRASTRLIVPLSAFSIWPLASPSVLLVSPMLSAEVALTLSVVVPGVLRSLMRTPPVLPAVLRLTSSMPDAVFWSTAPVPSAVMLIWLASRLSSSLSVTCRLTSSRPAASSLRMSSVTLTPSVRFRTSRLTSSKPLPLVSGFMLA